jgi:hypothetical protein
MTRHSRVIANCYQLINTFILAQCQIEFSLHFVSAGAISAPISVDVQFNIDIAVKPNQP